MKPKSIIILVFMLHNLSDAVPSDHNRVLRRLPEDRRRMALFPKIAKKFVITSSLEATPTYITSIKRSNDLKKIRVMPKIIPQYEKETIVAYKPPATRRPLMKIMKFTLIPYPVQPQSNEDFVINRINKKKYNRYDTFGSYENESEESMHLEDNKENEEDEGVLIENKSVEDDYDNDVTTNSKNIESQEENHSANTLKSNVMQSQTGTHQHSEEVDYGTNSSKTLSNEEVNDILITNPSEKYGSGEDASDGEILNDTESMEGENEGEEANSENLSEEIFEVKFLDEIEDSNDVTTISNEELEFTTETQFNEEREEDTLGFIGLQHDQTTFATTYLNTKTSVTKSIEKRTEEFSDLYNIDTIGPVVDKIRTRFKRNKRHIIEEENLGTTAAGFKFTGREPLLNSDLIFKNINT